MQQPACAARRVLQLCASAPAAAVMHSHAQPCDAARAISMAALPQPALLLACMHAHHKLPHQVSHALRSWQRVHVLRARAMAWRFCTLAAAVCCQAASSLSSSRLRNTCVQPRAAGLLL